MDAGLPNITGISCVYIRYNSASGAMQLSPPITDLVNAAGVTYTAPNELTFNASRSSSVYGSSTTVTPLSLSTIPIIRY